ncbi:MULTISPECIES: winged helix-turn-helix domain-containing protein [unclassified Methanosarcina]|uniref:helix-turn-helix transcriptional regulator n=1 Tax=unclassified Methanosarcina TaxID=2644672 RepID=UPI0006158EDD|nr:MULTISPECIES: winged helix-turn-helix domain-containing protein [unclassified Methanosarcina]AKB18099.1 Transcriptional regulator, ArsR family [Methanosarcina sp. WWM596]AKB21432.1 Transcriptional regulator, ArsR family [Methanosarcina sp. WH1]
MKLELIELIFLSDKRKQLLLFLKSGPKNMDEITEALQVTSTSILPQIKKLKDMSLVVQEDKTYILSLIGKVLVEKMKPLVSTIELFEDNFEYWSEKDLQGAPPSFRKRLGELRKCELIQPDLDRMFEVDPKVVENLSKSSYVLEAIAYFHQPLISLCQELAIKGVKFSFLMSESVFQRYYQDYTKDFRIMMSLDNVKFFRYSGELKIANLVVSDKFFLVSLFPKNQRHFDRESLISYELSARQLGTEIFNELLLDSTPVTEIPQE